MEGAKMLGMCDRIGSLSSGKQADIVAIDARSINTQSAFLVDAPIPELAAQNLREKTAGIAD